MAQKLEVLQSITRGDYVICYPGFSGPLRLVIGTNTYLIGEGRPYTLIDTGEGKSEYIPLLESVLEDDVRRISDNAQQHISDIIISHWHPDHVGGIPFPDTFPPDNRFALIKQAVLPGSFEPSITGALFHDLKDGQCFPITTRSSLPEDPPKLRVVHSPGHTEDSICMVSSVDKVLYTADTVLGQGSTIFENLGTYMSTLRSLLSLREEYVILYPGHGPVVQDGAQSIEAYINHRMEREEQILRVLERPPPEGKDSWSTWDIVSTIYAAYPRNLWESAARGLMVKSGKLGGEGKEARWELLVESNRRPGF
ncbi:beta-lactamase-like protein [Pisolithus microcarpus]|nr:beta-lactamase-like protein [Pisolithus microcarpus]